MRNLSVAQGLVAALKADTLSFVAWQAGTYGWIAIVLFAIFRHPLGKSDPVFGVMMQLAMGAGFLLSCPANYLLMGKGIKERM